MLYIEILQFIVLYSDDIGLLSCTCPVFRGLLFGDQDVWDSVINRYHSMRGGLKNGEPRPAPNEGAGLRNAISRYRLMRGRGFEAVQEPPPHLLKLMKRHRPARGRVSEMGSPAMA